MTGIEVTVGLVFAWLVRKARRVGGRADAEVDRGLDAGMDRLHDLVSRKLGADPALQRAEEEAKKAVEAGEERPEPSERTRRRLTDSLEDAAEHDRDFTQAMQELVAQLQEHPAGGGVAASSGGQAVGGDVSIRADRGSAAALNMGDVRIGSTGNPSVPGLEQG